MTLLAEQNMQESSGTPANALTVWGYSPSALHDLFWLSKEVAIVRPGSTEPISPDARLFLLIPAGKLFRLHLRFVLDQLFWMPRALYLIGLNPPTRRKPAKKHLKKTMSDDQNHGDPTALSVDHGSLAVEPAARVALTPHREIADYWRTISTTDNVWMGLRRQYPDFGSIKVSGIAYAASGCSAMDYLQALARDWSDPEIAIAGITRLAHRVYGPIGFDMSMLKNHTRPLWIGNGCNHTSANLTAPVLPDSVPVMIPNASNIGRK
jgi:hypothetical protein